MPLQQAHGQGLLGEDGWMPGSSPGMTDGERLATERRAGKTVIRVRP